MPRILLALLGSTLLLVGCDSAAPTDRPPVSEQVFGTEHYDAGIDLLQTGDGGLMVGGKGRGVLAPADGTIPTPNLTRLDADGRVLWSRLYDDLQGGELLAVHQNGPGYVVLIRTGILTNDENALRLETVGPNGRRTNRRSRLLYQRAGGTAHTNQPLRRTHDGGFILAGTTSRAADRPRRAFLTRLDATGAVLWERTFDDITYAWAVVQTTDGGFVMIGSPGSEDPAYDDVLLLKVGSDGSVLWRRAYGTDERRERAAAMVPTSDGGAVVVGQSDYYGEERSEEWGYALRVASDGTQQWSTTYGDEAEYDLRALTALRDGGFMLAGRRREKNGETDALLLRINEKGTKEWQMTFGEEDRRELANAVIELHDGRVAFTGATGPDEPSYGGADFDVFVRFVPPDAYRNAS